MDALATYKPIPNQMGRGYHFRTHGIALAVANANNAEDRDWKYTPMAIYDNDWVVEIYADGRYLGDL